MQPPSSHPTQFQPSVQHTAAEQLMTSVGLHTVASEQDFSPLAMNIGSISPGYSPPAISPIQHHAMFPPVAARSPRGVLGLMRRLPSVLTSPGTFSGAYRLSHPLTSHHPNSVSWVTQSQSPPVYPFPPSCGPHSPPPVVCLAQSCLPWTFSIRTCCCPWHAVYNAANAARNLF